MSRLVDEHITCGGVLYDLHLSAQIVVDVSAHLNAELKLACASDYGEAVSGLGERGILRPASAQHIARLSGFRDILVHQVLTVDPLELEEALRDRLTTWEHLSCVLQTSQREGHIQSE